MKVSLRHLLALGLALCLNLSAFAGEKGGNTLGIVEIIVMMNCMELPLSCQEEDLAKACKSAQAYLKSKDQCRQNANSRECELRRDLETFTSEYCPKNED